MYASVRTYELTSGSMDDLLHRVDDECVPMLRELEGFLAYQVVDEGDGRLCSISIFRDEDGIDRSNELAAEWVAESLTGFEIDRIDVVSGEIRVNRAVADVLQPEHA